MQVKDRLTQLGCQVLEPGKASGRRSRVLSGAGAGLGVAQEGSQRLGDGLGLWGDEDGPPLAVTAVASDVGGHDRSACTQGLRGW